MKSQFEFSNAWFDKSRRIWDVLIPQINPSRVLEVGSYEGASSCYLIETIAAQRPLELTCIDTWEGGVEHAGIDMSAVEKRFHDNVRIALSNAPNSVDLCVLKGTSSSKLASLICSGKIGHFDLIYIDGSHQAPDVILDAILSFQILRIGGIIIFDDYLWQESLPYGTDPVRCPKMAIDAFTNIYCRKIRVIESPLYQLYVQKISD